MTKKELEEKFGKLWDTKALQEDFIVKSFLAPFVFVIKKSDGRSGTLTFQHNPRFYLEFTPDDEKNL